MNLREARKKKKLDQFLTERDQRRTEDDASERFKALTEAMALGKAAEKPRAKHRTSRKGSSED